MNKKTKKILIIIGVFLAAVVAFLIYWKATEHDRYVKERMNVILELISEYQSGEISSLSFWLDSSTVEDPVFIDFLSKQVSEILDDGDYNLLYQLLQNLEDKNAYISEIRDNVTARFESVEELKMALEIKEKLEYLDYYNANLSLNRNSTLVDSYIKSNGVEEITTTPGTGYYANKKDSSSKHTVGLSDSPLYNAKKETYRGDFFIEEEYGVELNSYYEETSYSRMEYHFRGKEIDFSPNDGECIYSGNYLFCFDSDGILIGYAEIDEN